MSGLKRWLIRRSLRACARAGVVCDIYPKATDFFEKQRLLVGGEQCRGRQIIPPEQLIDRIAVGGRLVRPPGLGAGMPRDVHRGSAAPTCGGTSHRGSSSCGVVSGALHARRSIPAKPRRMESCPGRRASAAEPATVAASSRPVLGALRFRITGQSMPRALNSSSETASIAGFDLRPAATIGPAAMPCPGGRWRAVLPPSPGRQRVDRIGTGRAADRRFRVRQLMGEEGHCSAGVRDNHRWAAADLGPALRRQPATRGSWR